jgi:hypothetical protein
MIHGPMPAWWERMVASMRKCRNVQNMGGLRVQKLHFYALLGGGLAELGGSRPSKHAVSAAFLPIRINLAADQPTEPPTLPARPLSLACVGPI